MTTSTRYRRRPFFHWSFISVHSPFRRAITSKFSPLRSAILCLPPSSSTLRRPTFRLLLVVFHHRTIDWREAGYFRLYMCLKTGSHVAFPQIERRPKRPLRFWQSTKFGRGGQTFMYLLLLMLLHLKLSPSVSAAAVFLSTNRKWRRAAPVPRQQEGHTTHSVDYFQRGFN